MNGCNYIFYTPEYQYPDMPHGEMCGDLMPFYHEGKFIFVYLYKYCIYAIETKDFVHYDNHRLVLQNGTPEEQDWHAATGGICKKNDLFYFYYTGFCEGNRGKEGKYEQAILRAVSSDLIHWEKDRDYLFVPDEEHYAGRHWRDPHVFWNEELGKYSMLVTACEKNGANMRSGCTAVYVSDDILNWTHYKTICSPRIYPTMECQDCFKMNHKWYLTYSSYEKQWETKYKLADSFEGPWRMPVDENLDGRDFYAAKTVSDGVHRYLVGWQSIRKGCTNQGRYVWGGNVVVHELLQRKNGELGVKLPDSIRASFSEEIPGVFEVYDGNWKKKDKITGCVSDGFGWAKLGNMSNVCLIHTKLSWDDAAENVGILFHTSGENLETWCQLKLEVKKNRIILERSGKTEDDQFFEESRYIQYNGNTADITIVTSNDIIVAYVDDVALCGRCYQVKPGSAGIFVEYGSVTVPYYRMYRGEEENIIQ